MMSVSSETQPHDEKSVLELEFEQNREAPSLARAAISGFSENRDMDAATLATLTLLVSEVVTNAVIHPEVEPPGAIRLAARIAGGRIRVEVTDEGSGFTPEPQDPSQSDRGYGLFLLENQASAWGVDRKSGNTVWFELSV
jgi:anti-sigma regulatory factor (Ser/Thr protein kinase)